MGKQTLIKLTQHVVVTDCSHCRHKDGPSNVGSAACNFTVPLPFARLPNEWSDSNQASNLSAGQLTEFWKVGQECTRNCVADARKRLQEIVFLAPDRRRTHKAFDIALEFRYLLFQNGA